jgi:hypothetical protein
MTFVPCGATMRDKPWYHTIGAARGHDARRYSLPVWAWPSAGGLHAPRPSTHRDARIDQPLGASADAVRKGLLVHHPDQIGSRTNQQHGVRLIENRLHSKGTKFIRGGFANAEDTIETIRRQGIGDSRDAVDSFRLIVAVAHEHTDARGSAAFIIVGA